MKNILFILWFQVSRAVYTRQLKAQPMMDIAVAIISVPILVIFSFMLQRHMRSDWLHNVETRWRILGLGLSLLFISLVVCLYVTHRLGLCIWAAQQQRESRQNPEICRRVAHRSSTCVSIRFFFFSIIAENLLVYKLITRNKKLPFPQLNSFPYSSLNYRVDSI